MGEGGQSGLAATVTLSGRVPPLVTMLLKEARKNLSVPSASVVRWTTSHDRVGGVARLAHPTWDSETGGVSRYEPCYLPDFALSSCSCKVVANSSVERAPISTWPVPL